MKDGVEGGRESECCLFTCLLNTNGATLQQEAIVVVLDVGVSMSDTSRNPTRLSTALKAVELLVQQKLVHNAKHELGIVLFGCDGECFPSCNA